MRRASMATLAASAIALALGAGLAQATPSSYPTTVSVAALGGTVLGGTVTTTAPGRRDGVNLRRRCREGRLVDFSPPHGALHVRLRTDSKGRWSVTLPPLGSGTYKAFVTARYLPDGLSCSNAVARLVIP